MIFIMFLNVFVLLLFAWLYKVGSKQWWEQMKPLLSEKADVWTAETMKQRQMNLPFNLESMLIEGDKLF